MRIVILGGGVVGVTTAYQLQRDGHEVEILERNGLTAAGTSWGNAGMICPGHAFAWSSPEAPQILFKSLFLRNQSLSFRFSTDWRLYRWSWLFLNQCAPEMSRRNTAVKYRLAAYSQRVLGEVAEAEGIEYDQDARGILYFHRSEKELEAGVERMQWLAAGGLQIEALDRRGVLALDPAFESAPDVVGGIFCPTDATGDPAKFTRALAAKIIERGGRIRTGVTILGIETCGDAVSAIATDRGRVTADAYVLALGSESPLIAGRIGLDLPIYPVKGYSLTIPIGNRPYPPAIASLDEHNFVAISRFGDRLRVTATAELAGYDTRHKPIDFTFMKRVLQDLYPDGADYERAEMWAGLRPMTPTNLPLFGRRKHRNLHLNCGHGHLGWTMSHGSARIVADLIAGRPPEVPLDGLME